MKSVHVVLLTGMVIISSSLLAQTKADMTFTSSADLANAKLKYLPPSDKDKQEIKNIIIASSAAYLKGDVDAILTYYSDQSIELYPNQMINAGTGNIRNRLKGQFKYGSFTKMDRTVESIEEQVLSRWLWVRPKARLNQVRTEKYMRIIVMISSCLGNKKMANGKFWSITGYLTKLRVVNHQMTL